MLARNNGEQNRTDNRGNWQLKTLGYLFKQEHIRTKDLKSRLIC